MPPTTVAGRPAADRSRRGGVAIGVQIVGPCLEDRTTLAFAELIERQFGGLAPPAEFAH